MVLSDVCAPKSNGDILVSTDMILIKNVSQKQEKLPIMQVLQIVIYLRFVRRICWESWKVHKHLKPC